MPERRIPSPTSRSLAYAAAVSISRYPVAMAPSTAPTVSAGGVWKTPSPMAGNWTRLLRVMDGLLAVMFRPLLPVGLGFWRAARPQAHGVFTIGSFVECQRGRQAAELGDLPLKSRDGLLCRSDRVGA